jgi:protein-S-isoprenylcysteine O-methyltransferase Ste14
MEKLKYKLTNPGLMWLIVIAGALLSILYLKNNILFFPGIFGEIILLLGLANWLYATIMSFKVHRKAPASVNKIDHLVTKGPYRFIRHPIYAADIALSWCVFVFHPSFNILAAVIWANLVFIFWAWLEERMLEEKFSGDYQNYKKQVPMLIPRWGKTNRSNNPCQYLSISQYQLISFHEQYPNSSLWRRVLLVHGGDFPAPARGDGGYLGI